MIVSLQHSRNKGASVTYQFNFPAPFSRQGLHLLICKLTIKKWLFCPVIEKQQVPKFMDLQLVTMKWLFSVRIITILQLRNSYEWISSTAALNRVCETSPSIPFALQVPRVQVDEVDNLGKLSDIKSWWNRTCMASQILNWELIISKLSCAIQMVITTKEW